MRWAAFAGASALAANSTITGGDDDKHPYAVKVGGLWLSYKHLGPVKNILAAAANYYHGGKDGVGHAAKEQYVDLFGGKRHDHSIYNIRGEEPLTRPLLDFAYSMQEPDGMLKWLANETAMFDPSIIKQAVNATNEKTDYKDAPKSDPAVQRLWTYIKQAWEVQQGKAGKTKETLGEGPMPDALWRIFSPFDLGKK